jgi:hypothetical protein
VFSCGDRCLREIWLMSGYVPEKAALLLIY